MALSFDCLHQEINCFEDFGQLFTLETLFIEKDCDFEIHQIITLTPPKVVGKSGESAMNYFNDLHQSFIRMFEKMRKSRSPFHVDQSIDTDGKYQYTVIQKV